MAHPPDSALAGPVCICLWSVCVCERSTARPARLDDRDHQLLSASWACPPKNRPCLTSATIPVAARSLLLPSLASSWPLAALLRIFGFASACSLGVQDST